MSPTRADRDTRRRVMGYEFSAGTYLDIWDPEPLVTENGFVGAELPAQEEVPADEPELRWPSRPDIVEAYQAAWRLAREHVRPPRPGTGFVSAFIDTAFNDCVFLWDSVFIAVFARYARRSLPGQRTLDNLYAAQHPDGFITRELRQWDGADQFHRHDPTSTGPNLIAWSEWDHYLATTDRDRLAAVWPVAAGYHRWTAKHRSWPDGTMWTSGFGCGMDNIVRRPDGMRTVIHHGWLSWVDATAQQLLSTQCLLLMAAELGRDDEVTSGLERERDVLTAALERFWDEDRGWYCDLDAHGVSTGIRCLAGMWPLLTGTVGKGRVARIVAALRDEEVFGRPIPLPVLAANERSYDPAGDYWNGGVWSPTTYMSLRGLVACGELDLAHDLALGHVDAVVAVHAETGTLWENYAPEARQPGKPAKPDFVGWTGLSVTALLFEFVLGLRAAPGTLEWHIRTIDEVEVRGYPLGAIRVDLALAARRDADEPPVVTTRTPAPFTLVTGERHGGRHQVPAGTTTLVLDGPA